MNAIVYNGRIRRARRGMRPPRGPHRPSVAMILLATAVQIIAMAALLGSVANAVQ